MTALGCALATIALSGCWSISGDATPLLESTVRITTRDGVMLAADVFRPAGEDRYPTILEITPYGRGPEAPNYRHESTYWVRYGYAFVIVDARGQGDSEGAFAFFRDAGNDAHDVIEWIAEQPWSDDRVAMRGSSYSGTNQLYAAREQPPGLRCITPSAAAAGPMRDLPYQGGAFRFEWALGWTRLVSGMSAEGSEPIDFTALLTHRPLMTADEAAFGQPVTLYRSFLEHPTLDEHWRSIQLTADDYAAIETPTLAFTGWYDGTLPGTVAHYQGLKESSPDPDSHFLVIGPWEHDSAPDGGYDYRTLEPNTRVGDLEFPDEAFLPGLQMTRSFYEACLLGRGDFRRASAQIYLTGSNRWLESTMYPPPEAEEQLLYLHSAGSANGLRGNGRLSWEPPEEEPTDRFTYDPANPVWSGFLERDGSFRSAAPLPVDVSQLINRGDVLVYVTSPLRAPLTVVGNVSMVLHASSDQPDTDFVALIEDVGPDNAGLRLGPKFAGQVRARFRNGYETEEMLTPGEPVELQLDLGPIGHTFAGGHRIRITVSSSAYPWTSANPNTGNPIATDTDPPRRANQRVYHDAERPSHVILRVLPADEGSD